MKIKGLEIGDVVEIPLPSGRYAYGQYLGLERGGNGPLLRVFDRKSDERVQSVTDLDGVGDMFPPVLVGLAFAIRSRRWKVVGRLPTPPVATPVFRATLGDRPGKYDDWRIIYPDKTERVGVLPDELRHLEILQVWPPQALEDRIDTGASAFIERY